MKDTGPGAGPDTAPLQPTDRLDSWKEIGAYLKRDVRTVRRWEKTQGLPIHRHKHHKLASVYAYRSELDAWWNRPRSEDEGPETKIVSEGAEDFVDGALDGPGPGDSGTSRTYFPRRVAWLGVLVFLLAGSGVTVLLTRDSAMPPREISFERLRPRQLTFHSAERPVTAAAISPDGNLLAWADSSSLFVQRISADEQRRLVFEDPGREISDIAWLPNSSDLMVARADGIWQASVVGTGRWRVLEETGAISMSPDGRWMALTDPDGQTVRVASARGERLRVVSEAAAGVTLSRSWWSGDGERVVYLRIWRDDKGLNRAVESRLRDGSDPQSAPISGYDALWSSAGYLLFSRQRPAPEGRNSDLWAVHADARSGLPRAEPFRVYAGTDLTFRRPTITADGSRLVFRVDRLAARVHTAAFDAESGALGELTPAVYMTTPSFPVAWTPDGRALLFQSAQGRLLTMYRQTADRAEPELVVDPGVRGVHHAVQSPDNAWILYTSLDAPRLLLRVPVAGGTPETLTELTTGEDWIRCAEAPGSSCVHAALRSDEWLLMRFDPAAGSVETPWKAPVVPAHAAAWDLSADGAAIAMIDRKRPAGIAIVKPGSTRVQFIPIAGIDAVQSVAWAHKDRGWIVTRNVGPIGSELLFVDRNGQSRRLWSSGHQRLSNPLVSPDGGRIAFASAMRESNVWLLEGL